MFLRCSTRKENPGTLLLTLNSCSHLSLVSVYSEGLHSHTQLLNCKKKIAHSTNFEKKLRELRENFSQP